MARSNVWIYKWDRKTPGVFYGIVIDTGETVKGQINLSVSTKACNWILVFLKEINFDLKVFKFMKVMEIEYDSEKTWWCANSKIGPYEFVNREHVYYGAYIYFDSLDLH